MPDEADWTAVARVVENTLGALPSLPAGQAAPPVGPVRRTSTTRGVAMSG
ncbi:hypothetical protein AB0E63_26775 [Kribbella sp. NPDC026596]